jgi:alkanesulfonate monooxygenase SsuD/methylene tetrahydromethanopterin reductase-like flavin-dependent oxidoreductase (luciferase family)
VGQKLTFGVVIEQQHWSWASNVEHWEIGEAQGFDSIWINDHFHSLGERIDQEGFEASTTLAALAMETTRPKIGVLTYGNTHRNPAILAKEIVTIDHMSGGRAILGIGAGWNEPEHAAYGIPFPSAGDRVAMLDEALEVIEALERNERTTFHGRFYTLIDAPFVPKPVNGHIPVLIGGEKPKMMRVVGRHADLWDSDREPDEFRVGLAIVREHAREAGRDPEAIVGSASVWKAPVSDKQFADRVRAYYAAGVRQMLVTHPSNRAGIETIAGLAERVIPELRAELGG